MEEYEESGDGDGGGGEWKEGFGGDDWAYKSVDRDPYLRRMKGTGQNVDDDLRRGLALAGGLQWWPC